MKKSPFSRPVGIRLRFAEKTLLAFFSALLIASFTLSLPGVTRAVLTILNLTVGCFLVALGKDDLAKEGRVVSVIREWLPAVLILLAYRESGLFVKPDARHRLDHVFILWDRWMLQSRFVEGLLEACAPWLQHYLELCYLLCYPLVPLGFAVLYLARHSFAAQCESRGRSLGADMRRQFPPVAVIFDHFWTTVLLAALFCYAVYPAFPLAPPRVLFNDIPGPSVPPLLRHMNLWILDHLSVQVCVFPSAHAASVTATALAVRAYMPRLGIVFCIAALSVAAATVYGRYHYAADAVAGVLVGVAAFMISSRIHVF